MTVGFNKIFGFPIVINNEMPPNIIRMCGSRNAVELDTETGEIRNYPTTSTEEERE